MTNEEQKLREIAYKHAEPKVIWNDGNMSICPDEEKIESLFSDLTALISEKQAEYFEFVKWIGFYSTTLYYRDVDEKWLRTRFDIDGIPTEEYDEYTTEQLFEYWKTIEQ